MSVSLEIVISYEGRKHILNESYSKTKLVSQLLGRGLMEKSQISGPFGKYRKWVWSKGNDLRTELEETIFPSEETVLPVISLGRRGCSDVRFLLSRPDGY